VVVRPKPPTVDHLFTNDGTLKRVSRRALEAYADRLAAAFDAQAEELDQAKEEVAALRSALGDLEELATTVAISAAATAELARMVRTNQIRAEVGQ
jgi:hypothetical protein